MSIDTSIFPETTEILWVTVPATPVTVTLSRRIYRGKTTFQVERQPNGATFVNYLACGRDDEAEAREQANFLWIDTVARRDAPRF